MSGFFGVLDPEGAAVVDVLAATSRVPFRSRPNCHPVPGGVLGWFEEPFAEETSVSLEGERFVLVDGRVDGFLKTPTAPHPSDPAAALLADVLHRGSSALSDVAGNFALARFDASRGELFLVRDAIGSRPIYWARRGPRFAFASDPEFLFGLGMATRALQDDFVEAFLRLESLRPGRTAFQDIRCVRNGSWLRVGETGIEAGRWFRPEDIAPVYDSVEEGADALRQQLPVV